MAEAATAERAIVASDVAVYAEQALFERSPANLWITTAAVYAAWVGAFALAAWADGVAWIVGEGGSPALGHEPRLALVLPLIGCVSLALQRWSWNREAADRDNFQRALKPDAQWQTTFSLPRLRRMTWIAVAMGAAIWAVATPWRAAPHWFVAAWFLAASTTLTALFIRGLELTRAGSTRAREVIRHGLNVDLLRIERLHPWGRAAARTSMVWFAVSAAVLLLFVDGGFDIFTLVLLAGCVGMGVTVFVGTLTLVHHRIRAAKAEEVEALRVEITETRTRLDRDAKAPPKLQALLAYEKRIADTPEWPFDQTILVRLGASSLLLAVPWFGQAVAQLVVEKLGMH